MPDTAKRHRFRLIGPGRAGSSLATALAERGWSWAGTLGRRDDTTDAGSDVDAIIIAVPDDAIARVASTVGACDAALVHLSGAKTLDALKPHRRRASFHPLLSIPSVEVGVRRLLDRATVAISGDPVAAEMADALGARRIRVDEEDRARYHATAAVAANHLVVLCDQVAGLADSIGIPVDAYWSLMRSTLDNVTEANPLSALTGPAARGDTATIAAHLDALPAEERPLYQLMSARAAQMAARATQAPTGESERAEPSG